MHRRGTLAWARRLGLLSAFFTCLLPAGAQAQYKNSSFGLDAGGTFITRPSIVDANGNTLANSRLPLRLAYGERLGSEINFKLHDDHWWFTGRLNVNLLHYATFGETPQSINYAYDQYAQTYLGALLGLEGQAGVRYFFFTDRMRPYLQLAISYMHLFSFTGQSSDLCSAGLCQDGGTYGDVFLPHSDILAVHLQPGIEVVVKRDLALHFSLDYARWVTINTAGNNSFTLFMGVLFYG
jgi:hypothetical protein